MATKITRGPVEIDPDTFAPVIPVTIWLSVEPLRDLRSVYALDAKSELAKVIGQEIVNFLENNDGY